MGDGVRGNIVSLTNDMSQSNQKKKKKKKIDRNNVRYRVKNLGPDIKSKEECRDSHPPTYSHLHK